MEVYKTYQKAPLMKSVQVYEQLKKELMEGKWNFGAKILVNSLIERFNVSRRPVMDALKMLENDGFIQIVPQSGCKVIDFSKKDFIDHFLISSSLESLCAAQAAIHRTEEQIEALEQYQEMIKKKQRKFEEKLFYFKYNREFHYHISIMTGSERIRNSCMQLWDLNDFYLICLFEHNHYKPLDIINDHDQIFHSIRRGDPGQTKKLMEEHLSHYIEQIMDLLPV